MRNLNPKTFKSILFLTIIVAFVFSGLSAPKPIIKQSYNSSSFNTINPVQNKWNGFEIIEFKFEGVDAKIVFPKKSNPSKN